MGNAKRNIQAFPRGAQKSIGDELQLIQFGGMPKDAKPFKVRVITIIDRRPIGVSDVNSSIWHVLGVPVASSPYLPLCEIHTARPRHAPSGEVLTSVRSRERRGQGDGKDRSRLDAAAASWRLPKARAGCRGCGSDGKVATDRHVHRERATPTARRGLMQRTTSVPLHPRSARGLEPKQAQDLLHRDLGCELCRSRRRARLLPHSVTRRLGASTTVPFPLSLWGTGTALLDRSVGPLPTSGRAAEPAGSLQRLQHLAQALVLDPQANRGASPASAPRLAARRSSTCSSRLRCFRLSSSSSAMTSRWVVSASVATSSRVTGADAGAARCSLESTRCSLRSPQIQVRVAEGMDVTGAAQPLAGGGSPRGVLPRVMHQQHRQVELPLQRAKVRQQLGHFAGVVLVDAVKSHQGIQNEQPGPEPPGCLQEPRAVRIAIEPEHGRGDHVDLDLGEIETAMPGHSRDPLAHDRQRVLGQVDQDRPRLRHGVLAQARRAGGHREGHVQSQPCLGALGGTADHADRRRAPEPFHKPALGALLAGSPPRARREAIDSQSRASSHPHFLLEHGARTASADRPPGKHFSSSCATSCAMP